MKYVNADLVLPQQLLQEVQKYMQGGMLYIPKPEDSGSGGGELRRQNLSDGPEPVHS